MVFILNLILEKFKELEKFEKRIFVLNNKNFIVSVKPLTIKQMNFFLTEYTELSSKSTASDFFDFLNEIFIFESKEDAEVLLNNQETIDKLFEWLFREYLYFNDFKSVFKKGFLKVEKESNSDFISFFKILVNYGYKVSELEKLTSKEIVNLALKEKKYRGSKEYYEFIKEIGNLLKDEEILDIVKEELDAFKNTNTQKKQSSYDMLASL